MVSKDWQPRPDGILEALGKAEVFMCTCDHGRVHACVRTQLCVCVVCRYKMYRSVTYVQTVTLVHKHRTCPFLTNASKILLPVNAFTLVQHIYTSPPSTREREKAKARVRVRESAPERTRERWLVQCMICCGKQIRNTHTKHSHTHACTPHKCMQVSS